MAQTLATIWLCGALPMVLFLWSHERPRYPAEWLAATGIVILWPAFVMWCAFGSRDK